MKKKETKSISVPIKHPRVPCLENNRMTSFNECTIRMKAKKMTVLLVFARVSRLRKSRNRIDKQENKQDTKERKRIFNTSKIGYIKF